VHRPVAVAASAEVPAAALAEALAEAAPRAVPAAATSYCSPYCLQKEDASTDSVEASSFA
jgi:hypothetical protein